MFCALHDVKGRLEDDDQTVGWESLQQLVEVVIFLPGPDLGNEPKSFECLLAEIIDPFGGADMGDNKLGFVRTH
jgi:hypothetical protein